MSSALASELAVAQARAAARDGDLEGAERLLHEVADVHGTSPTQLDLLARVHAQQGRYPEADACWEWVQAQDPAHVDATTGRALVAEIVQGRRRERPVVTPLRVAAAAAALLVLGGGTAGWAVAARAPDSPPSAVAGAPADAAQRRLAELASTLAASGAVATARGDVVEVAFDQGLFVRSNRLSAAGERALADVAGRLAGTDVTVVGHAVAVPGGPQSGGSIVSLGRALTAARVLAAHGGPPLTALALRTADQSENPFPEADRNRTVTLRVRLAGP